VPKGALESKIEASMAKSKHEALVSISEKLQKLLPHLGNDNSGEADNARIKINYLLSSAGLDWHDLGAILKGKDDGESADLYSKLVGNDEDKLVALEPIREVWIHDEAFAASRLSMMRIMARRTNAATVVA
jgi:hypothetical protein